MRALLLVTLLGPAVSSSTPWTQGRDLPLLRALVPPAAGLQAGPPRVLRKGGPPPVQRPAVPSAAPGASEALPSRPAPRFPRWNPAQAVRTGAVASGLLWCLLTGAPCAALPASEFEGSDAARISVITAINDQLQPPGSPVAKEVAALLDRYYLDRSFNGVDIKAERQRFAGLSLEEDKALDESTKLVKRLGDRYTRILPPVTSSKLNKYDVTGVGLNLVIQDTGEMTVGAVPPPESAAGRAGIRFGDVVLTINGRETKGMTSFDALEEVQKGKSFTVKLGGDAPRDVLLVRENFEEKDPVGPVRYRLVDGTGYLKLKEFNADCAARVREAVQQLTAAGAKRLVLDLRHNGGGVLDGAIRIAGMFMEKPLVLYVTDANGVKQPLYSPERVLAPDLPLEVWVDQSSASASEVLAGALKDNCRATVAGTRTFGKGLVQGVFGLSDGGALIETVASYATPSGTEINRIGVIPSDKRLFLSDAFGQGALDLDVKAAVFPPLCSLP